jgi:hypothetical protein
MLKKTLGKTPFISFKTFPIFRLKTIEQGHKQEKK